MKKAQILKLNKKIRKDNAAFWKLSAAAKRVAIAEDVLKHLRAKKIRPTNGTYAEIQVYGEDYGGNTQLQEVYQQAERCDVCALGAMFFCSVKVADRLKVSEVGNPECVGFKDVYDYLHKFFSMRQLRLIEAAFESGNDCLNIEEFDDEHFAVYGYMFGYNETAETRMKVIMKNIIKNDGKFVVPKKVMAEYINYSGGHDRW